MQAIQKSPYHNIGPCFDFFISADLILMYQCLNGDRSNISVHEITTARSDHIRGVCRAVFA